MSDAALKTARTAAQSAPGAPKAQCAILYVPEAYEADKPNVVGRQSAGAGFLDALIRHGDLDTLYCLTEAPQIFQAFRQRVGRHAKAPPPQWLRPFDGDGLARAGAVFMPGPVLSEGAWMRRFVGERRYSLCGITHSVATERVIRSIRDFMVAPTQPWDALICTSECARDTIQRIFATWQDYLRQRGFAIGPMPVQFPVIPLGVDLDRFAPSPQRRAGGRQLRSRYGIGEDDIVLLSFGRLDHRSKAHPLPLFRAAEAAARRLAAKNRLHLMMVGQFSEPGLEAAFRQAEASFCPDVAVHWIDGADTADAESSWAAADVFVSLPDNVQESFGMTPVEAMAAALPCIVADWNGYKETVIDGETGFRIATTMAPPGAGIDLADRHARAALDHFATIALTAQCTAVDIEAAAAAIAQLAENGVLRRRMGAAGRRRAEATYGWGRIIARYQALWSDLALLRGSAPALGARDAARQTVHPDFPDLFALFSSHPSRPLGPGTKVRLTDADPHTTLDMLRRQALAAMARPILLDDFQVDRLVEHLRAGEASVETLLAELPNASANDTMRSLMWLAKYGVVALSEPEATSIGRL